MATKQSIRFVRERDIEFLLPLVERAWLVATKKIRALLEMEIKIERDGGEICGE